MEQSSNDQSSLAAKDRADAMAFPMFMLSVLFLGLLAGLIITLVDIPRVTELASLDNATKEIEQTDSLQSYARPIGKWILITLLLLWPLFWIEYVLDAGTARDRMGARVIQWQRLLACVIPPLRIGAVSPHWGNRLWLPSLGWRSPGRTLSTLLEQRLSKPMLTIALLILPILAIEFIFSQLVQSYFWLRILLHIATGFIWFAFTLEFIVMISASKQKLNYVKKNWIDLAIILIPLISFLRSLRVLRLARLARIQKIARLSRIYRMRSLGTKALKALLLIGFVNRLLKITPEKRLAKLENELREREEDVAELKRQIQQIENST